MKCYLKLKVRIINFHCPTIIHYVELSINHNKVETLEGLRFLPNLEIFSFAYNKIRDINQIINNIQQPELLQSLTYIGNYIEEDLSIDDLLLSKFPNLCYINGELVREEVAQSKTHDSEPFI